MIRILESKDMGRVLARRAARMTEAEDTVRPILEAVRKRGDKGLLEYARQFDQLDRKSVRVPPGELAAPPIASPLNSVPPSKSRPPTSGAMPKSNCRENTSASFGPGLQLGQIVRPLDTVAAYIPAGRYPLPSTLIMTAVPAHGRGREEHLRRLPQSRR